jgi:phosphate:Na+ symporter
MTVMLQSSSATMATVLTALHTGSVRFDQAAVLAVGAAVGTTVTGALAALGGNLPARRTALAHILFNLVTALMALGMLPLYLRAWGWMQERWGWEDGAISLAAFHTVFILVGVVVFLPWAGSLARGVERWLPDRGVAPTRHLDRTVLQVPEVALEAVRGTLRELAGALLALIRRQMEGGVRSKDAEEAASLRRALEETEAFLQQIPAVSEAGQGRVSPGMLREALWHGLDHLLRLQEHWHAPVSFMGWDAQLRSRWGLEASRWVLEQAERVVRGEGAMDWERELEGAAQALAALRRRERVEVLRQAAEGFGDAVEGLQRLDAMRWLDRVGYHAWRIANYLAGSGRPEVGGRDVGHEPVDSGA